MVAARAPEAVWSKVERGSVGTTAFIALGGMHGSNAGGGRERSPWQLRTAAHTRACLRSNDDGWQVAQGAEAAGRWGPMIGGAKMGTGRGANGPANREKGMGQRNSAKKIFKIRNDFRI